MFDMSELPDGYDFFTGVPDSRLKFFIRQIENSGFNHIPALNEGQAIGIAVGAELAGSKSCVYLQNSGLGNCINALTSLCIPHNVRPLIVVGHRHTLPQHKVMGEVDEKILEIIDYSPYIIIKGDNNVK